MKINKGGMVWLWWFDMWSWW